MITPASATPPDPGTVIGMASRRIAVLTILLMVATVVGFTFYYSSSDTSSNWTLPVFVSIIVVEAMIGFALMWRARRR